MKTELTPEVRRLFAHVGTMLVENQHVTSLCGQNKHTTMILYQYHHHHHLGTFEINQVYKKVSKSSTSCQSLNVQLNIRKQRKTWSFTSSVFISYSTWLLVFPCKSTYCSTAVKHIENHISVGFFSSWTSDQTTSSSGFYRYSFSRNHFVSVWILRFGWGGRGRRTTNH